MAKIGIDARMYGKGQSGLGTYIKNICDHVLKLDNKNEYSLFLRESEFSQYKAANNIRKIKVTAKWYSYPEQTTFLFELNKYKLDLMHFPHFNAPILYNRPRIHTIHDITPKFFPGHKLKSSWRKKGYQLTINTSLKKSEKIITISNNTKNDLIKHFQVPADKIEVIYLGIEAQFKVIENYAKIKELKAKYGITKPYIFFISAWRNHKNFQGLIKAFAVLKEKYKLDYQLVLGGQEDPNYPDIKKEIDNCPVKQDIIIPGFISNQELPLFYNAAELYVIPSLYEGFGITGLEAMSCGTPVVSSNKTSLPEIMGQAAEYFDPNDTQEIASNINQVLINQALKQQLITKGFEQIKKYSWTKCAQKTLDIYNKILKT